MSKMRVAVIGSGISGLASAYILAKAGVEVVIYEKEDELGGHVKTVNVDGYELDLGFITFNSVTYPNLMEFFESLGVDMVTTDTSFSVSLNNGKGCEWGSRNGLSGLFAQKKNILNPYFWLMLRELIKFKSDVLGYLEEFDNNPDIDRNETLGHFINSRGYSELFQKAYLGPLCASIWSSPSHGIMSSSAYSVLNSFRNHQLLQLFGRPQWLALRWSSQRYVNKLREELEKRGCQIRCGCGVDSVSAGDEGCNIICEDGSQEVYNGCMIAVHAPDALRMLGKQATCDETRVLGAFQYVFSDIYLHHDKSLMPQNPAAWSAMNFVGSTDNKVSVTWWLNVIQNIAETRLPYFVTLNPSHTPEQILIKWSTSHPVQSVDASKASLELDKIQGKRGIWFCGAYQGYGLHEDGLKAGMVATHKLLKSSCDLVKPPKQMVPSLIERGARLVVTRFFESYILTGCLNLLEEGGTVFTFEGTGKKSLLKTSLKVHNPQFYWKVATQADIGFADAYINGDFSFADKNEGLLDLFMIFIANRDLKALVPGNKANRGWWSPLLLTAGMASAKYFLWHVSRRNSINQAQRNIACHYDLSNEFFALFMDETMTYSTAIFKTEGEDLKVAQLRKISMLIKKARIDEKHHILEIGCGWGSFAVEVVKQTGCKYTGITLSEEQLKFAKIKVKEAGLQDQIRLRLCDYRQLPDNNKYDRTIACEMIQHVGSEYIEEFFSRCESSLAEDGLLVLQFSSIPDQRFGECNRTSDFLKEYIFPGGCLLSLSKITSAMAASSRLCVEHVENMGIHYYQTLRCWKKNFLENKSKILALGFDEKFIRKWEYYFDYCAAGFKSHTVEDYQVVFSRPGNVTTFGDPYKDVPLAY